jgi:hypothetical protein
MSKEKLKPNIYKKIFDVQHECESVIKDEKRGLQYKPLSYNSVNAVVRPALEKHKLTLIPYVKSHEQDGNQTRCVMAARVVDIETGEHIDVGDYFGYGNDTQDKGPGKAMSYAYKYLLLKLFLLDISDEEDSEKGDNQKIVTQNKDKQWIVKFENDLLRDIDFIVEDPTLTPAEKVHAIMEYKDKVRPDFEKLEKLDKGKANMIANKVKLKIEELKPNDANTKPA